MGDPVLYLKDVGKLSLLLRNCPACGHRHIFGFYSQIKPEQKQIDRERMVVTITDVCSGCGATIPSEYELTTTPPLPTKVAELESALAATRADLAIARRWLVWFNAGLSLRRNAIARGCTESQLAEIRETILAGIIGEQDRRQFEIDWPILPVRVDKSTE